MLSLQQKIKKSKSIIQKAITQFPTNKLVIAWTGGKDSTVLLHLIKSHLNTIPFPIMFNDSTMEFDEIYDFIKKITSDWKLNLITIPHSDIDLQEFHTTNSSAKKKELSRIMKVNAIHSFVATYNIQALMAGIRWDEHESRSKETYISHRDTHTRIHPILHFTEKDIWEYIHTYRVPYVNLYDQGYRSLGEKPFTKKAKPGEGERSGRERDKEQLMERLRSLGYW